MFKFAIIVTLVGLAVAASNPIEKEFIAKHSQLFDNTLAFSMTEHAWVSFYKSSGQPIGHDKSEEIAGWASIKAPRIARIAIQVFKYSPENALVKKEALTTETSKVLINRIADQCKVIVNDPFMIEAAGKSPAIPALPKRTFGFAVATYRFCNVFLNYDLEKAASFMPEVAK